MKIAHVYFDCDLRCGHKGLKMALRKNTLSENECAIFINKAWTGLKMLTPMNVLLYLKRPNNQPIEPDSIKYLPNCVDGGDLNYSQALNSAIAAKFHKKYPGYESE